MKTIGVIIPNYNSGIYIKRCLDSLLEQEYRVNEIIVVDDCSTDESTKIVKEYTKKYNNIILLENEKNMGVSYSRNRGIENTKSEYIMFCDSDDWYEKQATKKMMEKVEDIATVFNSSKKNFKRALGVLMKKNLIVQNEEGTFLR